MNRKGLVGLAKFGFILSTFVVLFLFAWLFVSPVFAGDFSVSVSPSTVEAGTSSQSLNFTIDNTDGSDNITTVNITIANNFTITGGNITNATNANYFNDSVNASWTNASGGGMLPFGNSGYFVFDVDVPAIPGTYTFTVTTEDNGSSINTTSLNITVQDTTSAAVAFTSPTTTNGTESANVTYVVWNITFADDAGLALIEINGTNQTGTCVNATTNSYCYYNETSLSGNVTRCAWGHASDAYGNWNTTPTFVCRNTNDQQPDTTAPSNIVTVSPTAANGTTIGQSYVEVNVTFTEVNPDSCAVDFFNGSTATNFTAVANSTEKWCYVNITGQTDGVKNYTVYVNDTYGNYGSNGTYFVTTDATAPSNIIVWAPTNGSWTTTNWVYVNVSFTESNPHTCLLDFNQTTNYTMSRSGTTCTYNVTGLNDGTHNFTVYVNDTYGNLGSNGTYVVSVDTTSPASIVTVLPTDANNSVVTTTYFEVNVTYTETNPDTCLLDLNNGTAANLTMTINTTEGWCYRNVTNQGDGTHTYSVYLNDSAGNYGSNGTYSIIIDSVGAQFIGWNYSFMNKQLTLNFDDTVQAATLNLSLLNISFDEGGPSDLAPLTSGTIATTGNATTLVINFTSLMDTRMKEIAYSDPPEGILHTQAAFVQDQAGRSLGAADVAYSSYDRYTIDIALINSVWTGFNLPLTILQNASSLGGNYSVETVLASIANNYTIIYYYNGSAWTSYVPGRPINDFTTFTDDTASNTYWVYTTVPEHIQIV